MTTIDLKNLQFCWPSTLEPTLNIASFNLRSNEKIFIRGPSGSGKSTLLSAISGIIDVEEGTVFVAGTDVGSLKGAARDRFRVDHLGIIFQAFNLLPWLSAIDNVLLPCRFSQKRRENAGPNPTQTAAALLAELGLTDSTLLKKPASELSVGQQQRVAAARALIGSPDIVLADEPTSALDEDAKNAFVGLLLRECNKTGASLLFVSHDSTLERHFDRTVNLPFLSDRENEC